MPAPTASSSARRHPHSGAPSIWRPIASSPGSWQPVSRKAPGANVLGDPRTALAWLANELSALGVTLAAGQTVTTGTCVTPMAIAPGDTVEADFGALGRMGCRFADS